MRQAEGGKRKEQSREMSKKRRSERGNDRGGCTLCAAIDM